MFNTTHMNTCVTSNTSTNLSIAVSGADNGISRIMAQRVARAQLRTQLDHQLTGGDIGVLEETRLALASGEGNMKNII